MSDFDALFRKSSIDKQLIITNEDNSLEIRNKDIYQGQIELVESLCDDNNIRFGACETSQFRIKVPNIYNGIIGEKIYCNLVLDGLTDEPFRIGEYKIVSSNPTSDKNFTVITSYDSMYDIINRDMADWYNSILPNEDSTVSLKEFRDSFFNFIGIEQVDVGLVNDNMIIGRTINPSSISGKDIICAICEINGCFGHINRLGMFNYITLNGLVDEKEVIHSSLEYEDYYTYPIDGLTLRTESGDIGVNVGYDIENNYIVEGNFLLYGKGSDELTEIANNMFSVITGITFIPSKVVSQGNLTINVGDTIVVNSNNKTIETYVLNRTMTGIQGMMDCYVSKGDEYLDNKVNSQSNSIEQLKGKTNILERDVEKTLSRLTDVEKGMTEYSQTAEMFRWLVSDDYSESNVKLSSKAYEVASKNIKLKGENIQLDGDTVIGEGFTLSAESVAIGNIGTWNYLNDVSAHDLGFEYNNYSYDLLSKGFVSYNIHDTTQYRGDVIEYYGKNILSVRVAIRVNSIASSGAKLNILKITKPKGESEPYFEDWNTASVIQSIPFTYEFDGVFVDHYFAETIISSLDDYIDAYYAIQIESELLSFEPIDITISTERLLDEAPLVQYEPEEGVIAYTRSYNGEIFNGNIVSKNYVEHNGECISGTKIDMVNGSYITNKLKSTNDELEVEKPTYIASAVKNTNYGTKGYMDIKEGIAKLGVTNNDTGGAALESVDNYVEVTDTDINYGFHSTVENPQLNLKLNGMSLFDYIYPVGSIYISVNNTNPSLLFGGVWERWGQGRTILGANDSDTEVEIEGGSETHTLTINELPSHQHKIEHQHETPETTISSSGAHNHDNWKYDTDVASGTSKNRTNGSGANTASKSLFASNSGAHTHKVPRMVTNNQTTNYSSSEGGGNPFSIMPPFITCYMWKRIE